MNISRVAMVAAAVVLLLAGGAAGNASAHDDEPLPHGSEKAAKSATTQKNIKICPVSGDKVDKDAALTATYDGEVYHFCCADCYAQFSKDPARYAGVHDAERAGEPTHREDDDHASR